MSHGRQRVGHGQHKIEFLPLPVLEPPHAVVLARADERVKLLAVLRVPALDDGSVDRVTEDVTIEPGAERHENPGEPQREKPCRNPRVVGLTPADGGGSSYDCGWDFID